MTDSQITKMLEQCKAQLIQHEVLSMEDVCPKSMALLYLIRRGIDPMAAYHEVFIRRATQIEQWTEN